MCACVQTCTTQCATIPMTNRLVYLFARFAHCNDIITFHLSVIIAVAKIRWIIIYCSVIKITVQQIYLYIFLYLYTIELKNYTLFTLKCFQKVKLKYIYLYYTMMLFYTPVSLCLNNNTTTIVCVRQDYAVRRTVQTWKTNGWAHYLQYGTHKSMYAG